jgi:hypothetical protein
MLSFFPEGFPDSSFFPGHPENFRKFRSEGRFFGAKSVKIDDFTLFQKEKIASARRVCWFFS